ncbi:Transcriptional adapter [Plasmodiophora brassicae]|uniref:Transcriptional adapter n=1 Tax=Plasmodiophora brassicae TaxID=37360 RepID=A0A0G4IS25_PLABS|nr:hypothetical protein PBRA_006257 [Plasmodiophora brassicae]SPQ96037.1 unnamed protein product [Plasmodiophora brassicae]
MPPEDVLRVYTAACSLVPSRVHRPCLARCMSWSRSFAEAVQCAVGRCAAMGDTDGREQKRQRRASAPAAPEPEVPEVVEPPKKKAGANRYECDYCRKDISTTVRIRCAECTDFDLCLECFSTGVEMLSHKNDHPYRVIEYISEPIFDRDWGADEERLLLEGIVACGFGNWADIAEYVGTKSKQKCQAHYTAVYLSGATAPLPQMDAPLLDFKDYKKDGPVSVPIDRRLSILSEPGAEPASASMGKKAGSAKPSTAPPAKAQESLARMVGYCAKRGDFDTEYDNEAEKYLSDMEFLPTDSPEERRLKLDVIAIYNKTLDERQRRKDFILDRELLIPSGRKRSREERDLCQKMACFARFQSKEDHAKFIQGLINENRLRKRIEQLQEHRLMGIQTLSESVQYEIEKKKREANKVLRKDKDKVDYLSMGPKLQTGSSRRRRLSADNEVSKADDEGAPPKPMEDVSRRTAASPSWQLDRSKPGFEALNAHEIALCTKLRLEPLQLKALKDRIVKESSSRGLLNAVPSQLLRIDVNKTNRIFDLFVSTGWPVNETAISEGVGQAETSAKR